MSDVPLNVLVADPKAYLPTTPGTDIYVVCRLGNDSQIAADALRAVGTEVGQVRDVVGGLRAWARERYTAKPNHGTIEGKGIVNVTLTRPAVEEPSTKEYKRVKFLVESNFVPIIKNASILRRMVCQFIKRTRKVGSLTQ
ncbi:hypothetical protein H0H87_001102 [Tephrocybe sp. NHM501043]|nr:hypothetical protein H0H87_001102 [Tephrocybe sp. NHM501043]